MGKRSPQPAVPKKVDNERQTTTRVRLPSPYSPYGTGTGYSKDAATGERTVSTPYGSLQYQPLSTERPQDLSQLLTRYQDISTQGYSAPEYEARRAQAANLIKAQGQAAQRELLTQQARQGVRGGSAVAQQQRASQQIAAQRAALEQNLMLEDIKNRQAMMGQYGSLLGGAISREDRLAAENLKRDLAAQVVGVSAGITEAGLGLAEKEIEQSGSLFEKYLDAIKEPQLSPDVVSTLGGSGLSSVTANVPTRGSSFGSTVWTGTSPTNPFGSGDWGY